MAKKLYKERCFCKKIEDCGCSIKRDEIRALSQSSAISRSIESVDTKGRV